MVEGDDLQSSLRPFAQLCRRPLDVRPLDGPSLLAPGADRAEPDDEELLGEMDRLGRSEGPLPLSERAREASGDRVRDVVIPGDGQEGPVQASKDLRCLLELYAAAAVREIARDEHELGLELRRKLTECGERRRRLVSATQMEVGDVENARGHRRGRLYTRSVANEAPEIFDDVYLGLRAGGAVRKQRRGEPLSVEEQEAIGRWRRLSLWRKTVAIGAFALGTFGLGLTIGGLIFGRWRKARA